MRRSIKYVRRKKAFLRTNSTGSAFEQLMPDALGAGGVTEDTLALQHELAARARRRRFTPDEHDTVEDEKQGDERLHVCASWTRVEVRGGSEGGSLQRRSVRAAGRAVWFRRGAP